ncbi:HXXEE domain-containing protein [Bifidobacterium aquikefiricola]|uniref:HXXEE domain-containing protein n=2 Tax=Bifidobacterium TaxID=1678 RepID=A0AB39U6K6_9BIFI
MMDLSFLAFSAFTLFVIHEFEEIIRCRPWIHKHKPESRYANDMWIRNQRAYPSTETIAVMILEEIVLAASILLISASLNCPAPVFAVTLGNSIHLAGHIVSAIISRAWNPGSVTAAVTLPLNVVILMLLITGTTSKGTNTAISFTITSLVVFVALAANLALLHRIAPRIHAHIHGRA